MSFTEAVRSCFTKYAVFHGRAPRSEYWYWVLFMLIVGVITSLLDRLVGWEISNASGSPAAGFGWLTTFAVLVLFIPGLAVQVRRLHDINRSGWWWWLNVLCGIGTLIVVFVFYIRPSDPGDNMYGPPSGTSGQA